MKRHRIPSRQSRSRARAQFGWIKEHRRFMLDLAMGLILAGKVGPGYMTYRREKYKEVAR